MASKLYNVKKVKSKKADVSKVYKDKPAEKKLAKPVVATAKTVFTSKDGKFKGTKYQVQRHNKKAAAGLKTRPNVGK